MDGSNRRMLDEVWVKTEPLWEDSGGCVVNYTSYEVKRETPPLIVFPEKALSMSEKSKDNPISPKESNITTGINAAPYSIVCHIKKEPEDSVNANGFEADFCSQEIKKEDERIDGSYQADLGSDYVKPAGEKCGATGYSGTSVGQTALNREPKVKVEGWESVSEEERARLYAGHQVEMVAGPESLQPSDAAFALQGSPELATVRDQVERENRTATSCGTSDIPLAPTPDTTPEQQDSLLIVHKPKRDTYACDICKKEFKKMGKLTRHKKTHMGEKPYACGKCDKKFTRPHHLREHDRSHTGEMPYSCDLCGKKFPFARQLKHHGITHSNVKPFTCDVCQKGFTQFGHLMTHKRLHTGEKPYTCEICEREFAQLVYLKEHVRVHSGVKEYRCDVCKKEFTRMGELRRHRLIHTKDKPYECATCKKAFKQSSHLKRHQLVHTKVKQFSCDICLKCFTQKSTLGKHKLLHSRKDSTAVAESVEKVSDDKKRVGR